MAETSKSKTATKKKKGIKLKPKTAEPSKNSKTLTNQKAREPKSKSKTVKLINTHATSTRSSSRDNRKQTSKGQATMSNNQWADAEVGSDGGSSDYEGQGV
mmetsp:Transcript_1772/g.2275  ORF Transcript_1772/g.2275 Transcript_1772/m.2275 type:complete len:101 (-) Transcript_1772:30-332(-)